MVTTINGTCQYDCTHHPVVKGFLPPYLENIAFLKQSQGVLGDLKDGLTSHLVGSCQYKLVLAKGIVYMLVTSIHTIENNINSGKGITRLLGVDRQNNKRGVER